MSRPVSTTTAGSGRGFTLGGASASGSGGGASSAGRMGSSTATAGGSARPLPTSRSTTSIHGVASGQRAGAAPAGGTRQGTAATGSTTTANTENWACERCTLINPGSAQRCSVCDAARPQQQQRRAVPGQQSVRADATDRPANATSARVQTGAGTTTVTSSVQSAWACARCTLVNDAARTRCDACDAPRPGTM